MPSAVQAICCMRGCLLSIRDLSPLQDVRCLQLHSLLSAESSWAQRTSNKAYSQPFAAPTGCLMRGRLKSTLFALGRAPMRYLVKGYPDLRLLACLTLG